MSAQGQSAGDIARLLRVSDDYVRDVIHAFNERGFAALDPKWSGGPPRKVDEPTRVKIRAVAGCDPRFLGRPFSVWSLTKLRDHLVATGAATGVVAAISTETSRRILREGGLTCQSSKTKPARLRATYHRHDGVWHMLAALDSAQPSPAPGSAGTNSTQAGPAAAAAPVAPFADVYTAALCPR